MHREVLGRLGPAVMDKEGSDDQKALVVAARTIAELMKAVPVPQDALAVWGAEEFRRFAERIGQKLEGTPSETRQQNAQSQRPRTRAGSGSAN